MGVSNEKRCKINTINKSMKKGDLNPDFLIF